jgi:thiamine-monophosphate kinase
MDISDGLSGDLLHICQASGLQAILEKRAVPVDPAALLLERAKGGDAMLLALHGGEDYQFLFAIPPDHLDGLKDLAVVWDLPLTVIGEFTEGPASVSVKDGETLRPLEPQSHDHFRRRGLGRRTE